MSFQNKEVVWAKVKGYPWWPASINKLPEDSDGNFKVFFFAQDTYAFLQPKFVQNFEENYKQHSKTKAKKFVKALQLANNSVNRLSIASNTKSNSACKKKAQKKQSQECPINSHQHSICSESNSEKKQQSENLDNEQIENLVENQTEEIDRKKIDKVENQLSEIISNFQANKIKEWKHGKYFEDFNSCYQLKSEQILSSNLTRKIRFIIQSMKKMKFDEKEIDKLEMLSTSMKKKVLDYLTDTAYYDQHLRIIDKSRHNKAQLQTQVMKIMKRRFHGLKKQYINILALQIGSQVGKNHKFKTKEFIADLKDGKYDGAIKSINSKAATQRIADQFINRYKQ